MVACTVILGHACPGFLSGTRGSLGTATEVNFRDPPAQSRNNYRMSRSASFPVASGLQLFWMRQFLRNRDVSKQLQTSVWLPKPRDLATVRNPCLATLSHRVPPCLVSASRFWRHVGCHDGVTFPSLPHRAFPTQRIRGFLLPGRVADSGVCRVCRRSWRLFRRIVYLTVDV